MMGLKCQEQDELSGAWVKSSALSTHKELRFSRRASLKAVADYLSKEAQKFFPEPSATNPLDPLWRHPRTGAVLYVGDDVAARNLAFLENSKITHVVNCTSSIPNYHEKHPYARITYFHFDVLNHYQHAKTESDAVSFTMPMLDFVVDALSKGKNVMVHCSSGAHRSGTTGIICLMYLAKLSLEDATKMAMQRRPVIEPVCDFPVFLEKLERAFQQHSSDSSESTTLSDEASTEGSTEASTVVSL